MQITHVLMYMCLGSFGIHKIIFYMQEYIYAWFCPIRQN
jgi:hypothetical protein